METVLVDARNVLRSRWPNIPERRVVELCAAWAERAGVQAFVVFDGNAPGHGRGEREHDGRTTVVGTGGESADAWLVRAAARLRGEGRAFALVTSDRELRPELAVVLMSGYGDGSAGIDANAFPFLQKPFTHDSLLATVRDALDARAAA